MHKDNILIAPSMLACDLGNIQSEAQRMISSGADWLHLDIMDGHFVPNITFGVCVVAAIHKHHPNAFLDCHLMVSNPLQWIDALHKAGASSLTFHVESNDNIDILIEHTHSLSMSVGLAISPNTNIDKVLGYNCDMILVMTVNPGFGGQKIIKKCLHKVSNLRELYPEKNIQVDGGISEKTIEMAWMAGANVFVAGSALFGAGDAKKMIDTFRTICKKEIKTN